MPPAGSRPPLNRIVISVACPLPSAVLSNGHGEEPIALRLIRAYGGAGPTSRCWFFAVGWERDRPFKAAEAGGGAQRIGPRLALPSGDQHQRLPGFAGVLSAGLPLLSWRQLTDPEPLGASRPDRAPPVGDLLPSAAGLCSGAPLRLSSAPRRATTLAQRAWPQLACRPLITAARKRNGPCGMGPDGPASLRFCGCQGRTDGRGFGAMACGPLHAGNSNDGWLPLPSRTARPGQPTAPGVCWRAVALRRPWATCSASWGHGVARAGGLEGPRQAERADRGALRHRLQAQRAELAPLLRAAGYVPSDPPEGSGAGGLAKRGRVLLLVASGAFERWASWGEVGAGMCRTATEHSYGLGVPALSLQARGAQFKTSFASRQEPLAGRGGAGLPHNRTALAKELARLAGPNPRRPGRLARIGQAAHGKGLAAVSASPPCWKGSCWNPNPARGAGRRLAMMGCNRPCRF